MYVPKKLQGNFVILQERHKWGNIIVKGELSCCDNRSFAIKYSGADERIVFIATCQSCNNEIQVFNGYTDGYDNIEEESHIQPALKFNDFICVKCQKSSFATKIVFEYQSKEYLEEDSVNEYENAFSWIWISPVCVSCNKKYKNLVDVETA